MYSQQIRLSKQSMRRYTIAIVIMIALAHSYQNAMHTTHDDQHYLYSCIPFLNTNSLAGQVVANSASIYYNPINATRGVKFYDGSRGYFMLERQLTSSELNALDFAAYNIFFITHGNSDRLLNKNEAYNAIAASLSEQLNNPNNPLSHRPYKIIGIDWSTGAGKVLGIPHAKTLCRNEQDQNMLMSIGEAVAAKLADAPIDCDNVIMIGHSFGSAINFEIARNMCDRDNRPRAIVLNPANRLSGIHIFNYAQAFRDDGSIVAYTDSLFDERIYVGLTHRYHLTDSPYPIVRSFNSHKHGREWFTTEVGGLFCDGPNQLPNSIQRVFHEPSFEPIKPLTNREFSAS